MDEPAADIRTVDGAHVVDGDHVVDRAHAVHGPDAVDADHTVDGPHAVNGDHGPLRRTLVVLGWATVITTALIVLSQFAGVSITTIWAVLQSLTPYGILATAVVSIVAAARRRRSLAIAGAVTALVGATMFWPLLFPPERPEVAANAPALRIGSFNLLFSNSDMDAVAAQVAPLDLDVVVFVEYTFEQRDALRATPLAEQFSYTYDGEAYGPVGLAVWSRYELVQREFTPTKNRGADVVLDTPFGPLRLLAVHPPTPIDTHSGWSSELGMLGERVSASAEPVVVIGDFNASYWHPPFRDLLDQGLRSAHISHRSGFSASWPTDKVFPAFVRLDHALLSDELVATEVTDIVTVGSDHKGVVVTVSPALQPTP